MIGPGSDKNVKNRSIFYKKIAEFLPLCCHEWAEQVSSPFMLHILDFYLGLFLEEKIAI